MAATYPLQGPTIDDGEFYFNFFDEVFIGFGPNVKNDIFNQNRVCGVLGHQLAKNAKLELNYLYQTTEHPGNDPATGQPVFESNQGFRLNAIYNIDFTHKAAQ